MKEAIASTQVPPFSHGRLLHSHISTSTLKKGVNILCNKVLHVTQMFARDTYMSQYPCHGRKCIRAIHVLNKYKFEQVFQDGSEHNSSRCFVN